MDKNVSEGDVFAGVCMIVAEQLRCGSENRRRTDSLVNDLGASSVDMIAIIRSVEETYELVIPEKDVQKFETLGDISKYIISCKK